MSKALVQNVEITATVSKDYERAYKAAASIARDALGQLRDVNKAERQITSIIDAQRAVIEAREAAERDSSKTSQKALQAAEKQLDKLQTAFIDAGGDISTLDEQLESLGRRRQSLEGLMRAVSKEKEIAQAVNEFRRLKDLAESTGGEGLEKALEAAQTRARALGVNLDDITQTMREGAENWPQMAPNAAAAKRAAAEVVRLRDALRQSKIPELAKQLKQAEQNARALGVNLDRADGEMGDITRKTSRLDDETEKAARAACKLGASWGDVGEKVKAVNSRVKGAIKEIGVGALRSVGAGLVGAVTGAVSSTFSDTMAVQKNAALTGLTATQFANLDSSFYALGIGKGTIADTIKEANKKAGEALAKPSGEMGLKFQTLGIDVQGLGSIETVQKIADTILRIEDKQVRAETADRLLGGSGQQIIEALRAQGKTFSEFFAEAQTAEGALKDDDIQKQIEIQQKMVDIQDKFNNAIVATFGALDTNQINTILESVVKAMPYVAQVMEFIAVNVLNPLLEAMRHLSNPLFWDFIEDSMTTLVEGVRGIPVIGSLFDKTPQNATALPSQTTNNTQTYVLNGNISNVTETPAPASSTGAQIIENITGLMRAENTRTNLVSFSGAAR